MSPSPETLAAFEAWKMSELAAHYAAPCPDDLMEYLVDAESSAFDALQAAPVASADDMLLKLFPLLLRDMEPASGEPPFRPSLSRSYTYDAPFYERLIADLGTTSPALRAAMAEPCRADGEPA
jgi:hypothetical protein